MKKEKKHYQVVAAVVEKEGKILCMQRCRSRLPYISEHWEFPGGKRKRGECDHEALLREIKEEMDWDVFVGKRIGEVTHEYPDFCITLTAYWCKGSDEDFKMLEHLDYKWLDKKELEPLDWTEADRKLLEMLK